MRPAAQAAVEALASAARPQILPFPIYDGRAEDIAVFAQEDESSCYFEEKADDYFHHEQEPPFLLDRASHDAGTTSSTDGRGLHVFLTGWSSGSSSLSFESKNTYNY